MGNSGPRRLRVAAGVSRPQSKHYGILRRDEMARAKEPTGFWGMNNASSHKYGPNILQ